MPVRTATTELVAEGILELLPGGGVAVTPLTASDLLDVFEVRAAIEVRAARTVATRQPAIGLDMIEKVVADHKDSSHGYAPSQLLAADREFHMAILDATGNSYFRRSIMPVWSTVERAMVQGLNLREIFDRAWSEHEQIALAMRAGDVDLAEANTRKHLEFAAQELAKALPDKGE